MEELMLQWQMPQEVIEAFKRNGISKDHLKDLNEEYLKELCPAIGIRINLKMKIQELLESEAVTETATSVTASTITESVIPEPSHDLSFSIGDIFTPKISVLDFDLKTLLETSPCGKSILDYYRNHKNLDSRRRNRLTDIIIKCLFTAIVNNRPTLEDYNIITAKIINLFPTEAAGTYFTRPIKKSESGRGKSIPARGKLVDKVRNILFQSVERKSITSANKAQDIDNLLLELHTEDLEWLESHSEPWEDVKIKWKNTQAIRHGQEYNNVQDFISKWKILKHSRAPELIDADFEFLYPGKGQQYYLNWNQFIEKFIKLKHNEIAADETKENLLSSLSYSDTEEIKIPTQIALMVNVAPPKGRLSKKSKCSIQECLESIFVCIENPGDIVATIELQKKKAFKQKTQLQPYLIILGSLQNVRQTYLIIDELRYTFDSIQRAFDTLFKCYHVLNAKYPKCSEHIHLIIQRCVYNITTKFDNPVPYISDILKLASC